MGRKRGKQSSIHPLQGGVRQKYNPEPTLDEKNGIFDAVSGYGAVERREGFIDGFRYAVKLMCEVYAAPGSNQRGADT